MRLYLDTNILTYFLYNREELSEDVGMMLFDYGNSGIGITPVAKPHLSELASLPLYDDHRDPNDRLIIAQAIADRIPLISSDRKFSRYGRYGLEFIYNER